MSKSCSLKELHLPLFITWLNIESIGERTKCPWTHNLGNGQYRLVILSNNLEKNTHKYISKLIQIYLYTTIDSSISNIYVFVQMQCIRSSNIYNNECIFNFIVKDFLNRVCSVRTCVIMNTICLYEFLSGSPYPFLQYLPQSPYIHTYTHTFLLFHVGILKFSW